MAESLLGTDNLLVVSDADGLLLSIKGDPQLRNRAADDMNFVEGALWSESSAGTNAIGTAIAASHAVQVFAAEHFTEPVQRWTCSASPVLDPDTGKLLGIIDLTGDVSVVNPLSLAVVVATARAVEELLRGQLHDRDDRLRARYAQLLGPASAGAALVTGTGRILLDPGRRWYAWCSRRSPPAAACSSCPRASRRSPSRSKTTTSSSCARTPGRQAGTAAPGAARARRRAAGGPPRRQAAAPAPASPRDADDPRAVPRPPQRRDHVRRALRRRRPSRQRARRDVTAAAVAARYDRLRRIRARQLRSTSDFRRVRALLDRGAVRKAAEAYPGPLLPGSVAPGIERTRDELEGWMRQAVITSDDADALWAWVRSSSGASDLLAWQRLLADSPTRTRAAASRWRARARCARSSGSDHAAARECCGMRTRARSAHDRRAERVALASRGG